MHNHGFIQGEKLQCLKFRHTEVTQKKTFFSVFLKCTIVSDIYEYVQLQSCNYSRTNKAIGLKFSGNVYN